MAERALRPDDVLFVRYIREAQIDPAGKAIVYTLQRIDDSHSRDLSEIWIQDAGSEAARKISDGHSSQYPRWSPDGAWLAYVSSRGTGDVLVVTRVVNGSTREIQAPGVRLATPPAWSPDGRSIAIVVEHDTRAKDADFRRITTREFRADGLGWLAGVRQELCLLDVASGTAVTLDADSTSYSNVEWDAGGDRLLFLATSSPIPGANYSPGLNVLRVGDRTRREILGEGWFINSAKWISGGRRIAVVGAYRNAVTVPTTDLWTVNDDGTGVSCRSASSQLKGRVGFRVHHDMPLWSYTSSPGVAFRGPHSAWVTAQCGGRAEIWDVSLEGDVRCERVVGGDRSCLVLSGSRDGRKLLFLVTDLLTPPELHILEGTTERRVTEVNPELSANWSGLQHEPLAFRSCDGLEIEGWFLGMRGRPRPLPTILFIHGGPYMAAGHAFRFDFHLLASHGFGVLLLNFRGSFGYGDEFANGLRGEWGVRASPDYLAALDRAVELGLADPQRLGVWGASHGGFATCWLVSHTTRFRAAVAEAAVTNFETAYSLSDAPAFIARELGGKPHEIPDVYRRRSPLTFAHQCKTPTLMIHGEKDFRCPISEAEQFYRVLLDVGCTAELVRLRDADHLGDSQGPPGARVGQNVALLEWFIRYL